MREFANLYAAIDETNKTNEKVSAIVRYFGSASAEDSAWAVHFLIGPLNVAGRLFGSGSKPGTGYNETRALVMRGYLSRRAGRSRLTCAPGSRNLSPTRRVEAPLRSRDWTGATNGTA